MQRKMAKLAKNEIVRILSSKIRFTNLQTPSDNLAAYCPFHKDGQERTPSFYLYVGPTKSDKQHTGAAFCGACGRGWSFSGLLRALHVDNRYIDAVNDIFAEMHQKEETPYDGVNFETPQLPEAILGKFDYAPKKLIKEGFQKSVLKEFCIGFDKEHSRITFPLRDHRGNLVGISGRSVIGEHPRYKIYRSEFHSVQPGYELKKGRTVWGLDRLYTTAMTVGLDSPIIVCEGFKAAMWVVQHGFPNTVALIGAFCSKEQALLLSRVTNKLILFLDNDSAGIKATYKMIPILRGALEVDVANYPQGYYGKSPDDLGCRLLEQAINTAQPYIQWRTQKWATR